MVMIGYISYYITYETLIFYLKILMYAVYKIHTSIQV